MSEQIAAQTIQRKQRHVELCLDSDVDFAKRNGFERYDFRHNATPELNLSEIDLSTTFLGRKINYPLMISSMTGGYNGATQVNAILAEAAEALHIPLGVGSMRQALESEAHRESFAVVRKVAPSIPIFANIGAPEVAKGLTKAEMKLLLDLVRADGLIVHLNAAQELFQPEGNTNFKGFLSELRKLCKRLPVPVIAKEVGNGISGEVAARLIEAGVQAIDVAGAGGTNWQKVEALRYAEQFNHDERFTEGGFAELINWGIPTAECLEELRALRRRKEYRKAQVIASGGISNGVEIAKALALGADLAAIAKPFLKAAFEPEGAEAVKKFALRLMNDLCATMFLVGARNVKALKACKLTKKRE
ncbi:MAG: type 2 isopentenyl-diphosphate Delta-isomerase [Chloroherpetonaceae bacterium]|nr:type 2 isopentenyl-diphosphate Delta-isomerase [Chloroherpetonaceae bacterium]